MLVLFVVHIVYLLDRTKLANI